MATASRSSQVTNAVIGMRMRRPCVTCGRGSWSRVVHRLTVWRPTPTLSAVSWTLRHRTSSPLGPWVGAWWPSHAARAAVSWEVQGRRPVGERWSASLMRSARAWPYVEIRKATSCWCCIKGILLCIDTIRMINACYYHISLIHCCQRSRRSRLDKNGD